MTDLFHTKQTIYIVRHGVADHNVMQLINGNGNSGTGGGGSSSSPSYSHPNLLDPKYTDARLTPRGRLQAEEAGRVIRSVLLEETVSPVSPVSSPPLLLDAIITSPLTRCLETTKEMTEQIQIGSEFQGAARQLGRWIVREELREAHGIHFSDKRSPRSQLELAWPKVDFQFISEQDEDWRCDQRETVHDVNRRIDVFLHWLTWSELVQSQSQAQSSFSNTGTDTCSQASTCDINKDNTNSSTCLIISHGVWMECLFKRYFPRIMEGGRRVYNCNVFRAIVESDWEKRGDAWKCHGINISSVDLIHGE